MESMSSSRRSTSESRSEVSLKIPVAVAKYYKAAPATHSPTLLEMRKRILKVVPNCSEVMSYAMPAFKVNGNIVAGLRINKSSIGYYPFSGSVLKNFTTELKPFTTTRASLQIPLGKPLTNSLVKTLIKARLSTCPVKLGKIDLSSYESKDGKWRELKIASPARRGLIDRNLFKLADLRKITELEFMGIHGIGSDATRKIKAAMKKGKVSFKAKRTSSS